MGLSLTWSISIWAIVVIITYVVARKQRIMVWDSIILAILLGYLFLLLFAPFGAMYIKYGMSPWIFIYVTISVLSPLLLAVYIFRNAIRHRSKSTNLIRNN